MTTSAVSGTNPAASLSSLLGATRSFADKTDGDGDSDSSRGVPGGGGTLFTALLAALTQFVTTHSAGSATVTPATPTPTTTPATIPATTPTTSGTSGATGGVPSTLAQDLHAFLHDLFHALRQEGHHRHGDDDSRHGNVAPAPASSPATTPVTATSPAPVPTPVTTTSTGTVTTPGVIPVTTPATGSTTATGTAATGTTGAAAAGSATPSGIVRYGHRGLAAELTALIQDLGNSSAVNDAAHSKSRVSARSLADLNASFAKLIGDLGGTVAVASTGTTAVPPVTGSTTAAGTAAAESVTAPAPGTGTHADTSALQSFLTSFLQDLQGSAASAAPLGNAVNVTA